VFQFRESWSADAESHPADEIEIQSKLDVDFGTSLQNNKKPDVKFQYGGRLFSETGSNNNLSHGVRYLVEICSANRLRP